MGTLSGLRIHESQRCFSAGSLHDSTKSSDGLYNQKLYKMDGSELTRDLNGLWSLLILRA